MSAMSSSVPPRADGTDIEVCRIPIEMKIGNEYHLTVYDNQRTNHRTEYTLTWNKDTSKFGKATPSFRSLSFIM